MIGQDSIEYHVGDTIECVNDRKCQFLLNGMQYEVMGEEDGQPVIYTENGLEYYNPSRFIRVK